MANSHESSHNTISDADNGDQTRNRGKQRTSFDDINALTLHRGEPHKPGTSMPTKMERVIQRYRDSRQSPSSEEDQRLLAHDALGLGRRDNDAPEQRNQPDKAWAEKIASSRFFLKRNHRQEMGRHQFITNVRARFDQRIKEMIQENPTLDRQQLCKVAMRLENKLWNLSERKWRHYKWNALQVLVRYPRNNDALLKRLEEQIKVDDWLSIKRIVNFRSTSKKHEIMNQLVKPPEQGASTATHNDAGASDFAVPQWNMLDRLAKSLFEDVNGIEDPKQKMKAELEILRELRGIRYTSYKPYYNGKEQEFLQQFTNRKSPAYLLLRAELSRVQAELSRVQIELSRSRTRDWLDGVVEPSDNRSIAPHSTDSGVSSQSTDNRSIAPSSTDQALL